LGTASRRTEIARSLAGRYQKSGLENAKRYIKRVYRNASVVANNRVVFNIKGNDYRLVVAINYECDIVYFRFIGTHKA